MSKAAHYGGAEGDGFLGGTSSGGGVRDGFVVVARHDDICLSLGNYLCSEKKGVTVIIVVRSVLEHTLGERERERDHALALLILNGTIDRRCL